MHEAINGVDKLVVHGERSQKCYRMKLFRLNAKRESIVRNVLNKHNIS